jgi:hypothetical protein
MQVPEHHEEEGEDAEPLLAPLGRQLQLGHDAAISQLGSCLAAGHSSATAPRLEDCLCLSFPALENRVKTIGGIWL